MRLTEKGYRVGVLEAGRRFEDDDFFSFPKLRWTLSHMREQIKKDFSVALAANGGMPAVKPEPKLHRA